MKGTLVKREVELKDAWENALYIALENAWLQMSPLGGYLYMSTSSINGDLIQQYTSQI